MSAFTTVQGTPDTIAGANDGMLNKNMLTTAGILVGGSTVVASLGLVATAMPAQLALAAGASAGLIYAGDRKDKDLPLNPWGKTDETDTETAPAPQAA